MARNRDTGKAGWAGQWDRHRWPVKIAAERVTEERRLRSLDEFERPPWHARPARERTSWAQIRLMLLAGVLAGLVWAIWF